MVYIITRTYCPIDENENGIDYKVEFWGEAPEYKVFRLGKDIYEFN